MAGRGRAAGGADVIIDPIGGDVFDASLRALAPEGRLLTLGYVSGRIPSAPANRLLLRNCDVRGVNWGGMISAHPELFRSTADDLASLLDNGMPPPSTVEYDLAGAQAAFTAIEQRNIIGKTVLLVRKLGADGGMNGSPINVQASDNSEILSIANEKAEIHHDRSDDDNAPSGADVRCGSRPGPLRADVPVDGPRIQPTAARPGTPAIDTPAAGVGNTGRRLTLQPPPAGDV